MTSQTVKYELRKKLINRSARIGRGQRLITEIDKNNPLRRRERLILTRLKFALLADRVSRIFPGMGIAGISGVNSVLLCGFLCGTRCIKWNDDISAEMRRLFLIQRDGIHPADRLVVSQSVLVHFSCLSVYRILIQYIIIITHIPVYDTVIYKQ